MYLDYGCNAGTYVIDIETDDLDATVIHVMCWEDVKTGEKGECIGYDAIRGFFEKTKGCCYVGHNILRFDAPVLVRLAGVSLSVNNCIDTLVLSTLYSPSLEGGHSLDAWGEKLGKPKIDFNAWSHLSTEMIEYCHQDVTITTELFRRLIKTMDRIGFSELSIWLQHRLTVVIDRQHRNGFYFDGPRAIDFYRMLRSREEELQDEIRRAFPPVRTLVADRLAYRQDGSRTAILEKDLERYEVEFCHDGSRYHAYEYESFNLGSPKQRVEKLISLGWEPEEFTPKTRNGGGGNPKPFDKGELSPSLDRFLEEHPVPEVGLIARWMSINGRANMVNTWLEAWNEDDSCIHGKLFVADTLRFRHQAPNTANIPAVRQAKAGEVLYGEQGYYTYESRDLWTARPGRVLVGTDAAGLELRMLAHYLNRPDFTKQVIEGDPHQYNADTVGIPRPMAKTLLYAIQYGAQAGKVASIIKSSKNEGARVRTEFLERLGLSEVMDGAIGEQRDGRIELVDGSRVVCPSPHSALNYKLQGGGARVMGLGAVILEGYIKRDGLDSLKVGDIHDEWQYDVQPRDAKQHAIRSVQAIREAGETLNLNLPLDGTAKEGLTWAETH